MPTDIPDDSFEAASVQIKNLTPLSEVNPELHNILQSVASEVYEGYPEEEIPNIYIQLDDTDKNMGYHAYSDEANEELFIISGGMLDANSEQIIGAFVHEIGHDINNDVVTDFPDKKQSHERELDTDAFAATHGYGDQMLETLKMLKADGLTGDTDSHPHIDLRIENVQDINDINSQNLPDAKGRDGSREI